MSVKSFILVLRSLTQKHYSFFMKNKEKFFQKVTEQEEWHEGEEISLSKSEEYLNLLGLLSHKNENDVVHDVWNIVLGLFCLQCLSFTNWSPSQSPPELTEDEEYLCLVIIHLWQLAQYNTHTMAEFITSHTAMVRSQEVGLAIRPNWTCSDLTFPDLTYPYLTYPDWTNLDLTCPDLTCHFLTCPDSIPNNLQKPPRHLPDPYQAPIRHSSDTHQILTKYHIHPLNRS